MTLRTPQPSPGFGSSSRRPTGYVVEHHASDGVSTTSFPTKKAARSAGMAIRAAGGSAFVYSAADHARFIAVPS
jgi:hypothetical protein